MALRRKTLRNVLAGAVSAAAAVCASPALADPIDVEVSGEASVVSGVSDGEARADADATVAVKGSKTLRNGLEVGAVVEGRFDKQQPNQIYAGGRYSSFLAGGPRGVGPLTSDAYLQGAYAYLRGGFGQVIVGRDHGVARTFAVTAPTIFRAINPNDWRSDLSGLNDVHTVNDFSGYSTKISFLPPANFLGGVLGGLQMGVSYSPELSECGDDLCAPEDRLTITPDGFLVSESNWNDVVEAALYYQKGIRVSQSDRLLVGVGASFVTADEDLTILSPELGDYEAYSLGINLGYRGLTVGGSIKSTNAGLAELNDQDGYIAFDAGVTYQTGEDKGDWGFMLGYGQSEANLVGPNPVDPLIFRDTPDGASRGHLFRRTRHLHRGRRTIRRIHEARSRGRSGRGHIRRHRELD